MKKSPTDTSSRSVALKQAVERSDIVGIKQAIRDGAEAKDILSELPVSAMGAVCLRVLLEAGADPNARGEDGMAPLMHLVENAARPEDVEKCDLLIKAGASLHDRLPFGRTPKYKSAGLLDRAAGRAMMALDDDCHPGQRRYFLNKDVAVAIMMHLKDAGATMKTHEGGIHMQEVQRMLGQRGRS